MKRKRFKAELQTGHKENAIEVPFDPAGVWDIPTRPLLQGRRGHRVQGSLNGSHFESVIVARSGKFFLLIAAEVQQATGIAVGDLVDAVVGPIED
jgi:uncharacterized protein DUF1905